MEGTPEEVATGDEAERTESRLRKCKVTAQREFFAVRRGINLNRCIFTNWDDCCPHVVTDDEEGEWEEETEYDVFDDFEEALAYVDSYDQTSNPEKKTQKKSKPNRHGKSGVFLSTSRIQREERRQHGSRGKRTYDEVVESGFGSAEGGYKSNTDGKKLKDDDVLQPNEGAKNTKEKELTSCGAVMRTKWDLKWEFMFTKLRAYKRLHGTTSVPRSYQNKDDPVKMGDWVRTQRRQIKLYLEEPECEKRRLSDDRCQRLLDLGLVPGLAPGEKRPQDDIVKNLSKSVSKRKKHAGDSSDDDSESDVRTSNKEGNVMEETTPHHALIRTKWDEKWELMFTKLVDYKRVHGTTAVPRSYEDSQAPVNMGNWVKNQRRQIKLFLEEPQSEMRRLSNDRCQRLLDIGLGVKAPMRSNHDEDSSDVEEENDLCGPNNEQNDMEEKDVTHSRAVLRTKWDEKWEVMFAKLLAYKKLHGTTSVPRRYEDKRDPSRLGSWVYTQRKQIKLYLEEPISEKRTLSDDRCQRLLDIGVRAKRAQDDDNVNGQFKNSCERTKHEDDDSEVETESESDVCTPNKERDDIGEKYQTPPGAMGSKFDRKWELMFAKLRAYKRKHGNTSVPREYENKNDPVKMGYWIQTQKKQLRLFLETPKSKKRTLNNDRCQRLLDIGLEVNCQAFHAKRIYDSVVRNRLMSRSEGEKYESEISDSEEEGHVCIPSREENPSEGKKTLFRGEGAVTKWDINWEHMFKKLVAYKREHGTTSVPRKYEDKDDPVKMGEWVHTQRKQVKLYLEEPESEKRRLSTDRCLRLLDIGLGNAAAPTTIDV